MKKPAARRRSGRAETPTPPPCRPWMSVLALMAAASRQDGGAGLQYLLSNAKFNERPHFTLTKRAA